MSDKEIPHGHKFDNGKPRFELIPIKAYKLAAQIMTGGASKYNENNWTGLKASRIIGAANRHINYFLSGQDIDSDSGQHHLGHFLANLLMLHHILNNFPKQDDRYGSPPDTPVTITDKHVYKNSRKDTTVPQYTLLPPDSLIAAANVLTLLASVDGDHHWFGSKSTKTFVEHALDNLVEVVDRKHNDLGMAIAVTMILIEDISSDNYQYDDRIFTYLED